MAILSLFFKIFYYFNKPIKYTDKCNKLNRDVIINELTSKEFDILIIGGGSTGASIALEASQKGLVVGLVQSSDFSSGTSSKYPTCILFQGGIQYRDNGIKQRLLSQFQLDKKGKKERKKYLKISNYLSSYYSIHCIINNKWDCIYYYLRCLLFPFPWFISFYYNNNTFKYIKSSISYGYIQYFDTLQQDARLNISLITTAISEGAICCNYIRILELIESNGIINVAKVYDKISQKEYFIKAKKIINATGSQCDFIKSILPKSLLSNNISLLESNNTLLSDPKLGIHMILNYPILKEKTAIIHPQNDGSVVFFIYYHGKTLAGIEDSSISFSIQPTVNEINKILYELNKYTVNNITYTNIQSIWTAWRPLIHKRELIRDFSITEHIPNVISITGGAWSEVRLMSETLINKIYPLKSYNITRKPILGSKNYILPKIYYNKKYINKELLKYLEEYYGNRCLIILKLCYENPLYYNRISDKYNIIIGEIIYIIRYELSIYISDILLRRLYIGYLDPLHCINIISNISNIMQKELNWNEETKLYQENITINELKTLLV